jgi:hypothetical protein
MVRVCSAGILQARLSSLQLIGEHQVGCLLDTEERVSAYQRLGKGVHPPAHRVDLTQVEDNGERDRFDQAGCEFDIGNSQGVLHRFGRQIVLLVPGAGPSMQCGDQCRRGLLQVVAQHLGKQVVIAIPTSLVIKRDDKQVCPVERFQHALAPLPLCHRLAERSAQALEDAGVQEKLLHHRRLPCEHLFAQVVQHIAMAAAKGSQKSGHIGSALQ